MVSEKIFFIILIEIYICIFKILWIICWHFELLETVLICAQYVFGCNTVIYVGNFQNTDRINFDGIFYNTFHKNIYKQSLLSGGSFFQTCSIWSKFSNSFLAQFEKDIIVINVIDNFVVSRNCVFFRTWRVLHSQNSKMNFICKYEIVFLSMFFLFFVMRLILEM